MSDNNNIYVGLSIADSLLRPAARVAKREVISAFGLGNIKVLEEDSPDYEGGTVFGTPVFGGVELSMEDYSYVGGNYNGINTKQYAAVKMFIPACIITVNSSKTIVKTNVSGYKGSIKEMYCQGDYVINIKGVLCDDTNKRPWSLQNDLRRLYECPKAIHITSRMLDAFPHLDVVIESINFPDAKQKTNIIPFELNCSTDNDYQMILNGTEPNLKPVIFLE